jgi:hypothetical protein
MTPMEEYVEEFYNNPEMDQISFINKEDDPVRTDTAGVFNIVYNKFLWAMFNQEANVFGVLPKTKWVNSGWRLMTERAGSTADGGVAEGGEIADSIKPTFKEVENHIKTVHHPFSVTEIQNYIANIGDDATADMVILRKIFAVKHKEAINQQLLRDASGQAAAASGDYTGVDGFETVDRVISSDSEEDAFGGTYDNYFDIFGLDRDSTTTYDSIVDHNSGVDRQVSDEILRTNIYDLKEAGGNPTVLITGYDTLRSLTALYSDQLRYSNVVAESKVTIGVNGIQTEEGMNAGVRLSSVYTIPLIASKDVVKDTISRIYFLDTSDPEGEGVPRICINVAKPTQYFQAGVDDGTPFVLNKFDTKGMYKTLGEIKCVRLDVQCKIRDLS